MCCSNDCASVVGQVVCSGVCVAMVYVVVTVQFRVDTLDLVNIWVLQLLPDHNAGKVVAIARLTLQKGWM